MLIATAGHVDHGKTSLVRCLTGVDTDRLPAEKARGLTIDAGFVYHDLGGGARVGFVDVPGHERFVRNMLAAVAAVDAAVLLVAADDGPMPQTLEHLDILRLQGIGHGLIVISKIDRVDAARRAQVRAQIAALVAGSFLDTAAVVEMSATTGAGVEEVRTQLQRLHQQHAPAALTGRFRLAVDRAFTVSGVGQIVTGAMFAGTVAQGDELMLMPAAVPVRVRSLHVQDQPATHSAGLAGERCALALAGAGLTQHKPARGDWLVALPAPLASARIDVRLEVLRSRDRPLLHWTPVHLHHGAAERTGRVAVLQGRQIEPGQSALVQLVLDEPVVAARGDRLVVRDQSARQTLAGGVVLEPFGAVKGRARPERMAVLAAMALAEPVAALRARLDAEAAGVDLDRFAQAFNLTTEEATSLHAAVDLVALPVRGVRRAVSAARWQRLRERLMQAVGQVHRESPELAGPQALALRRELAPLAAGELLDACLDALVRAGQLVRRGPCLAVPDHMPTLTPADQPLWETLAQWLGPAHTRPATVPDLARQLALERSEFEGFLRRMAAQGRLIRVRPNRYFHPAALASLAGLAEQLAATGGADYDAGTFEARQFREASGIGRNISIEVLEYFDTQGFTRRIGNRRHVLRAAQDIFGPAPAAA